MLTQQTEASREQVTKEQSKNKAPMPVTGDSARQLARPELIAIDPDAVEEARAAIPGDDILSLVVETFEALSDPTRARILCALSRRRLCVRDLAVLVGVSESAVSHQLRFLRTRRLVKGQREGTIIHYSLISRHLDALFREAEYHADHVLQGLPDHPHP